MKTRFLLSFAAAALTALAVTAAPAAAGTRVVFTIDVESNDITLPDQVNAICTDGSPCGLAEIARLLEARHWSGTFFLNVYEHRQWGERTMRDIALQLQNAGQDVELHTHPQWAYDNARWAMWQYSLDEQTTIVRDGVRLLQSWTGRPVVAHRAGAYTANEHTLTALQRNGVLLDSSHFWQYPNDQLNAITLPRNLPASVDGVLEIPVTVYERQDQLGVLPSAFAPVSVVRKLDPNWFTSEAEMRAAIGAAVDSNVPVIVVFLHSFSFIRGGTAGARLADRQAIDLFHAMLDDLEQRKLEVVSMRDLAVAGTPTHPVVADIVPSVPVQVDLLRYTWRRARTSGAASRALVGGAAVVVVAIGVVAVLRRRRGTTMTTRPISRASVANGTGSR